ncbi:hypothetical protein [Phytohabitans rumicis]|nr:hypothetical protein [Phytohabitans rumicis]
MTREQMREHARRVAADWPPLTPEQRLQLAVLLRPDLPVGITRQPPRQAA